MKNKLKLLSYSIGSGAFGVIFGLMIQGTAMAATNTCTWTGGGGADANWSTVANWSGCGGTAPVSGDAVVMDNSVSNNFMTDDIPGLDISSLKFINNGTYAAVIILAQNIIIDSSITQDSTVTSNSNSIGGIGASRTITAGGNLTISQHGSGELGILGGNIGVNDILALGSHNLTVSSTNSSAVGAISIWGNITGTGSISYDASKLDLLELHGDSTYSGNTNVLSGALISYSATAFGVGDVNIGSSASIEFRTSETTYANNFTIAGQTSKSNKVSLAIGCATRCNFPGTITLNGYTAFLSPPVSINIANSASNGFCVEYLDPFGNATAAAANVFTGNSPTSCTSFARSTAPAAPSTGSGIIKSNVMFTALGVVGISLALFTVSRRFKKDLRKR
ncbi:MAG: hypothetical protein WCG30_02325 [Candidatus Saccharibacteria bacterium]